MRDDSPDSEAYNVMPSSECDTDMHEEREEKINKYEKRYYAHFSHFPSARWEMNVHKGKVFFMGNFIDL